MPRVSHPVGLFSVFFDRFSCFNNDFRCCLHIVCDGVDPLGLVLPLTLGDIRLKCHLFVCFFEVYISFLLLITNYHTISSLKQHLYSFYRSEVQAQLSYTLCLGFHRTEIKCWPRYIPFWSLRSFSKFMWLLAELSSLWL